MFGVMDFLCMKEVNDGILQQRLEISSEQFKDIYSFCFTSFLRIPPQPCSIGSSQQSQVNCKNNPRKEMQTCSTRDGNNRGCESPVYTCACQLHYPLTELMSAAGRTLSASFI